jgi:hypothetical protein
MSALIEGITIGGAGGAIAGLTVWFIQYAHDKVVEKIECDRVYEWLKKNTTNEPGSEFRSTRAIASWNNLTENRVRHICSIDDRIFLSTGEKEDLWSIYERSQRSAYEKKQ